MLNGAVGVTIAPHISGKKLAKLMEGALNLERFSIIQPNIAIYEQQETQEIINQTQEDVAVNQATDIEGDDLVQ
jgi:predicted metal-dependent peptidase